MENLLVQKPWMVFGSLLLFFALYLLYKSQVKRRAKSKRNLLLGSIGIIVFSVFSFWGTDWFHYYVIFHRVKSSYFAVTHLEPVYVWIIDNMSPNYFFFRLIVWGGAFALLCKLLDILQLNRVVSLFFFSTCFLIWFSYSRVSLAMSMLFLGGALIFQENKKYHIFSVVFGFFGVLASIYFHKSAILGVVIVLIAILLNQTKSKIYILFLILIPLIFVALRYALGNIATFTSSDEYMVFVTEAGSRNIESEASKMGIGSYVQSILEKTPYYLSALCCMMVQRNNIKLPKAIFFFSNITIIIVLTSTLLLFMEEFNTSTLSTRLFRFCIIPATIILSYCFENGLNRKLVKTALWAGFLSSSYQLLYALYVII